MISDKEIDELEKQYGKIYMKHRNELLSSLPIDQQKLAQVICDILMLYDYANNCLRNFLLEEMKKEVKDG